MAEDAGTPRIIVYIKSAETTDAVKAVKSCAYSARGSTALWKLLHIPSLQTNIAVRAKIALCSWQSIMCTSGLLAILGALEKLTLDEVFAPCDPFRAGGTYETDITLAAASNAPVWASKLRATKLGGWEAGGKATVSNSLLQCTLI